MKKSVTFILCSLLFLSPRAQTDYSNYQQQTSRLRSLADRHKDVVSLSSIAKTQGGKDIWMLTVGNNNSAATPAIAVIGGTEGNHLIGTEVAIGFAEEFLSKPKDSITLILTKTTFYIFPNMSPDAMEQYFAPLKYERRGNAASTDDDRDGKNDEDGFEDLNGDGLITIMRVESPIGEYRENPQDPRSVIKADLTKGEIGKYNIYTEGRDNDKDGTFNEDGEGGVWFNKSLTYKYPAFTPGAGEFAVSQPEARGLLDKLYELFNVYAVVNFSSDNNLSEPYKFNKGATTQRIITGYLEEDAKINAVVSDMYVKKTGLKDAPKTESEGGDLLSWAYYHYGRFSFGTPAWWVPKAKPDTTKKEKPLVDSVADYFRWAAQENITPAFTEWKKIDHPDFPGQVVEVGGVHPFAIKNPPYSIADNIVKKHSFFILSLAEMQPQVDIINIRTEKPATGLTRITATVINKGTLPSHTKLGERNIWVKRVKVSVKTNDRQSVISGKKIQLLNSLESRSSTELTWLVKGSGSVTIEAGSPGTGVKTVEVKL